VPKTLTTGTPDRLLQQAHLQVDGTTVIAGGQFALPADRYGRAARSQPRIWRVWSGQS
jgi:hypothetical protein